VKHLLDTNIASELIHGNPQVLANLALHPRGHVAIAQPVVAEIEFGLALLPRGKRRDELSRRWSRFSDELLRVQWSDSVSLHFASIKARLRKSGLVIEDFDVAIAAHAQAWDLTLVTNNIRHFSRIKDLRLVDWTQSQTS
jgi:tRNA(fMet)-specific endonuclease VapC